MWDDSDDEDSPAWAHAGPAAPEEGASVIEPGRLHGHSVGVDAGTVEPLTEGRHAIIYSAQWRPRLRFAAAREAHEKWSATEDGEEEDLGEVGEEDDDVGGLRGWVALKAVNKFVNQERKPHDVLREARMLGRMRHPNVVALLNAYEIDSIYVLTLPLHPLSLSHLLSLPSFSPSPPAGLSPLSNPLRRFDLAARSLGFQLLLALRHLHDVQGIAHRDVNPANVVIDPHGCVKLIDFGVAWEPGMEDERGEGKGMHHEVATGPYRAPELLFGPTSYSAPATDLWSLGCTLSSFFRPLRFLPSRPTPISSPSSTSTSPSTPDFAFAPTPAAAPGRREPSADDATAFQWWDAAVPDQPGRWIRVPLFDATRGELGLVGSIFGVRGSADEESWPEYNSLPDANKLSFRPKSSVSLSSLLPNLPPAPDHPPLPTAHLAPSSARPTPDDLILRLLQYSPASRLRAGDALAHPWFTQGEGEVLLPDEVREGEDLPRGVKAVGDCEGWALQEWMREWLESGRRETLGL